MPKDKNGAPFWSWQAASADTEDRAVLVLSGPIDTGCSWYEDTVYPKQFRRELADHAGEPIQVEINSPGGDVFAGFEIYNMLLAHAGSVQVRIVGNAASAASLVAMAADPGHLIMSHASMMMVHNPWTVAGGNAQELREQADVLDMIAEIMCGMYMRRFLGTQEEMRRLLDEESWLTPARAQSLGLCDQIETPEEARQTGEAQQAAMRGRYAAMSRASMEQLRARMGFEPKDEPADPAYGETLLQEADALMAELTW